MPIRKLTDALKNQTGRGIPGDEFQDDLNELLRKADELPPAVIDSDYMDDQTEQHAEERVSPSAATDIGTAALRNTELDLPEDKR